MLGDQTLDTRYWMLAATVRMNFIGLNANMNTDLATYYAHRAQEYELIYDKPERQADLDYVANYLKKTFTDQSVYEILTLVLVDSSGRTFL